MSADVLQALHALHLLRPQWLWLLLALPVLPWIALRRRARDSAWRSAVDAHLLPRLLLPRPERGTRLAWLAGLMAAALAILALAGPSWRQDAQPLWQSRAPLVVALDLSPSVSAADLPPSRLAQARAKLATLLQRRAGGQVALVAYSRDAYTVAPLTDDAANVAVFLDALAPDIMPGYADPDGPPARADRAIERAAGLLRQAGFDRGDILLLTDHAGDDAARAAASARREGFRVSVLGLGTAAGSAYRDADGRIARAQLDASTLRALAQAGGGRYAALRADTADLARLGVLSPGQAATAASHGGKALVWRDQGYWLLLPVLLVAAFAFRRNAGFAVLALGLCLPCLPLHAQQAAAAPAAVEAGGLWRRPDQVRHQRMEQGARAYRQRDFAAAEQAWRGLPGADAAYNRGNALARQGDYAGAIAQYESALAQRPGMADALANKRAVEAAMKRRPPGSRDASQSGGQGQGQPKRGGQSQQGDQQDQSAQGDPDQGQAAQGRDEDAGTQSRQDTPPRHAPSKGGGRPDAPPTTPEDAAAQRDADAAQRARMRQALERAKAAGKAAQERQPVASPAETAAERERRLANEAWLRRVPDDPGGLLRARFALEHQRRQQEGR